MKFLHLTDLHFCPEKDGRTSRELRDLLPKYIRDNRILVDELFFTGDYRHALLQEDEPLEDVAKKAVSYLKDIADAAGITDCEHIHLIPGNHDLIRSEDKKRIKKIKKSYKSENGSFKKEDLDFLKSQLSFFNCVCKEMYGEKNIWSDATLHTYKVVNNVVILYLNTAITHNSDDDRNHIIIGNDYLDLLLKDIKEKYPDLPIIVLAHHALEYFEKNEREAVEQIFKKYSVKLYLCGDAHEVWWRNINNHTEITMGCLKSTDGVQATFLQGEFDTRTYVAHRWDNKFLGWGPYTQFNESIGVLKTKKKSLTTKEIKKNQEKQKNDVLLPWMKHSTSLQSVFPKLFIEPILKGEKVKGDISFAELLEKYKRKNIVVIGDAGFGKTTLLKFLYLFNNEKYEFLYLKASTLKCNRRELSSYEEAVLDILYEKTVTKKHKIILLDALDEAFFGNDEKLKELITLISNKSSNFSVWLGWRSEHYYLQETEELRLCVDNIISLQSWNDDMVGRYVNTYAEKTRQFNLPDKFNLLVDKNEVLLELTKSPFQLALMLYLLENGELSLENRQIFDTANQTIYKLYNLFFLCWLKKERFRKTSTLTDDEVAEALRSIARKTYYGEECLVECDDTAVTDLLLFSSLDKNNKRVASGFYHMSFCAYFYADSIFEALKIGDVALIEALRYPLRNDVTDFVRSAITTIKHNNEIKKMQENLMLTYLQIINPEENDLSDEAKKLLSTLSEETIFYLKNEVIYLITRLPFPPDFIKDFVRLAYVCEKDPYMKLDIAYGAALTGPSCITLEYAKSLQPGEEADLVNRSWTVAYFGDVQENPYYYRDIYGCPWTKARNARLNRFQSSKYKAIRFRILDFPLMYCFYVSRNWRDVNNEDLSIIEKTQIDCKEYSEEEIEFLKEQKEKLITEYRKHLKDI